MHLENVANELLSFGYNKVLKCTIFCLFRKAINASPKLKHLNLTSCRGVPRGLKQWHGGAQIRSLITTLEEMESGTNGER